MMVLSWIREGLFSKALLNSGVFFWRRIKMGSEKWEVAWYQNAQALKMMNTGVITYHFVTWEVKTWMRGCLGFTGGYTTQPYHYVI